MNIAAATRATSDGLLKRGCPYSKLRKPRNPGVSPTFSVLSRDRDTRPEPSYGTGAIVGLAKVDPMPKAGGKWNVYEITAKGSTFTVMLNGQKTASAQDGKFASGRIALQHGLGVKDDKGVANDKGVVKFRKVEIKPL
ncbi:MAG: DUF1080 domain-containing protein [Methylocella sp.]